MRKNPKPPKTPKIAFSIFAIALGIFIFIYGGFDDSPGAQAIGLLAAAVGIAGFIKRARANNKKSTEPSSRANRKTDSGKKRKLPSK